MRIIDLTIKNYRAFGEEKHFSFQPNLTIIAGVNGRGKTAILEGIALLLSRLLPKISPAKSGQRKITELDIHGAAEDTHLFIKVNCAGIPLEYALDYNRSLKKATTTSISLPVRRKIANAYGDPSRADDQAPLVVYYTTDRAGYRFPKAIPQIVPAGQAMAYNGALFNRTVDYKDFMARYRVTLSHTEETQPSSSFFFGQNVIQAVDRAIEFFLEGFSNLRVVEHPTRLLVDKNGEVLDIRQLSDGERSFIAMVCDLSRRLALANPELNTPLEGAGVVLIDEIELHLHPKWQLEVAEKLRTIFPNIQFIMTTHSPFIIQTAREGEVQTLDSNLMIDPFGKSLEEVARYVMDVQNTKYSPRIRNMKETARLYLALAEEAKTASDKRKNEIQSELIKLMEPFSDNPAYTALLESKGLI